MLKGISFRAFYDQEYCKSVLLVSAITFLPVKNVLSEFISANTSLQLEKGMEYALLLVGLGIFYILPFGRWVRLTIDQVLLFLFLIWGFMPFFLNRPEEMAALLKTISRSLVIAFPFYVVARNLKDYALFERCLFRASYIINISMVYVMYRQMQTHVGKDWYDMSMAYMILPGAMLAFRMLLRRFSIAKLGNFAISLFCLLLSGTRGPIVCFFVFLLYESFVSGGCFKKKKFTIITMIIFALLMGSIYVWYRLPIIIDILQGIGASVRAFSAIMNGTFFYTSGRGAIYGEAWKIILEYPFTGVGLLEDRLLIAQHLTLSYGQAILNGKSFIGYYSHMVFLDWLIEYGFFIGGFLCLIALVIVFKVFLMPRSVHKSCMELFFFCGFVPLLFSEHWIQSQLFYIFLGFAISVFGGYVPCRSVDEGERSYVA